MSPRECRCSCGALMARRTAAGIELKCRRCKRTWTMKMDDLSWTEALDPLSFPPGSGQRPPRPAPLPE